MGAGDLAQARQEPSARVDEAGSVRQRIDDDRCKLAGVPLDAILHRVGVVERQDQVTFGVIRVRTVVATLEAAQHAGGR